MELGWTALRAQCRRRPAWTACVDPVVQAHGCARLHGSGRALYGQSLRARPHSADRRARPRRAQTLPRRPHVLHQHGLAHRLHRGREGVLRRALAITMSSQTLGIIVNGATGRICSTQHLKNSLIPIRDEGGLAVGDKQVVPRPMLVGRDAARVAEVARTYGVADWTTDLEAALVDPAFPVFFDAAASGGRVALLNKAVAAGKHIYAEKPVAPSVADGRALLAAAQARGLKHGAVEDKLYLPGLRKLARVLAEGTLRRIVGFRLEFGWGGRHRPRFPSGWMNAASATRWTSTTPRPRWSNSKAAPSAPS